MSGVRSFYTNSATWKLPLHLNCLQRQVDYYVSSQRQLQSISYRHTEAATAIQYYYCIMYCSYSKSHFSFVEPFDNGMVIENTILPLPQEKDCMPGSIMEKQNNLMVTYSCHIQMTF